jgi:hypothetical protein
MEIRSNSNFEPTNLRARESSVKQPVKKLNTDDEMSTESTQKSRDLLEGGEEIRPEVIAKGKELASSPDYPPADVVEKLARFLSDKLK